jgi:hypothetical protein
LVALQKSESAKQLPPKQRKPSAQRPVGFSGPQSSVLSSSSFGSEGQPKRRTANRREDRFTTVVR